VDISGKAALPDGGPVHESDCRAYESSVEAREHLTALAVRTLGCQLADRAQAEAAWPALIAALRRAENAGYSPADALTRTAIARELHTARSVSELLAWRINRHLAAHSADANNPAITANEITTATAASPPEAEGHIPSSQGNGNEQDSRSTATGPGTVPLLPWVPGPRQAPSDDQAAPLTGYLSDAANLITTRIHTLADTAVRLRQPWTSALGQPPDHPGRAREWLRHVAVVAAYRDQHNITSDDPHQVLGPCAEPGHAGHKAYWHAAESVLAARHLSGLDPADAAGTAETRASAQVAADVFQALPQAEREAVATVVAETPGITWLGCPDGPDEDAASRPGYARTLTATLARRGHLSVHTGHVQGDMAGTAEPVEAASARRRHATAPRPVALRTPEPPQDQRSQPALRPVPSSVRAPEPRHQR
jgi:hypothetical protein